MPDEQKDGRPTKYKPEYDEQARKLCLLGFIDRELADFFEVTEQTINNWKKDFPSFFESIKKGKGIADGDVVDALRDKALTGDPTACIFWLKNRQPKLWRDRKDVAFEPIPAPMLALLEACGVETEKEKE